MNIRDLYNDNKMQEELKQKLDCLEDTNDILEKIKEKIDPKAVSVITDNELVIKVDRRKNIEGVIEGVRNIIYGILQDPDNLDLLFKIIEGDNEIIIRKRREKILG